MILTKPQVDTFWSIWARVCRDRNWTGATAERERKAFLARCGFGSLTKVDRTAGFTRVKSELLVLLGTSVQAGLEAADPLLNKARNFRFVIREELLPCLALYEENPEGYLQRIMADKARWWKLDRPEVAPSLEDFDARPIVMDSQGELHESPSQLEQILITLNARLDSKRQAAGHSLHEMRTLAGVKCHCRVCQSASAAPALVDDAEAVEAGVDVPF